MTYDPNTVLLQWQSTALRGNIVTPVVPVWPAKDPSEVVTLNADFGLFGVPGTDVVASFAVSPQDPALRVISSGKNGLVVTVMLAGGTAGTTAPVTFSVRLSNGQILTRAISLPILAQPNSPASPLFPLPTPQQTVVVDAITGEAVIDPKTGEFVVTQ